MSTTGSDSTLTSTLLSPAGAGGCCGNSASSRRGSSRSHSPTSRISTSSVGSLPASPTSRYHHGCIPPETFPHFTANSARRNGTIKPKTLNRAEGSHVKREKSSTLSMSHLNCSGNSTTQRPRKNAFVFSHFY